MGMSEAHGLWPVIMNVILSAIVLNLLKLTEFILMMLLLILLNLLWRPHRIPEGIGFVHDVHLGLEFQVKFLIFSTKKRVYVLVLLEEGIIRALIVSSIQLHVVQAIRILARIGKKFIDHGSSDLVSELVLLFVEELKLLLFADLLQLGPNDMINSGNYILF